MAQNNPVVSICCITYNHESFIRQCLDGFVMQKTNFPFEIIVHDDASLDNTANIVKDYEVKYTDSFRCVYQSENQFYKQNVLINILFPMSQGKYIALCEGDDYWTDPYKLQKQVDFLEANPEYSLCFHNAIKLYHDEDKETELFAQYTKSDYYPEDIIHEWLIPTASVVFRNVFLDHGLPGYMNNIAIGDFPLFLYLGEFGKYRCIDEPMSVYRILSTGHVKSELNSEKYYIMSKEMSAILAEYYKPKYKKDFAVRIAFDNYYLARFAARKGKRKSAIAFLLQSIKADPYMMFRDRNKYKYITLRRLFPKILLDILKGK